jgi:cobalt/nickel transport system permease protein
MHIPDGYLSPQTAGGLWALMVPVWYSAGYRVRRSLSSRQAPLIAIGAAFAFIIMMFNVPLPGGTTGHAAGGTLLAVVLGPWAAVISLSVALVIQALFFGDGGILSIGANCFNIAFALPLSGYLVYRLLAAGADTASPRRWLAAGVGAYVGINVAAFLTAVEIGVQGDLFHGADGAPLYAPYGLSQALTAMMASHLAIMGFLEAGVTALATLYLQRTQPRVLGERPTGPKAPFRLKPFIIWLLLMLLFVPLGLVATGTAWGEWTPAEIGDELGFVPAGLERFSGVWGGILPDYLAAGRGESFWAAAAGYLFSAALGLATVAGVTYVAVRLISRRAGRAGSHV